MDATEAKMTPHQARLAKMRERVRQVECPTCGAAPGENCRGRTGVRESNHRDRVEQAKAGWSVLRAQRPGTCTNCTAGIQPGQGIRRAWGGWAHVECR